MTDAAPRRPRRGLWIGLAAAALVVIAVIVGVSLPGMLAGTGPATSEPTQTSRPQDPFAALVPPVEEVAGAPVEGGIRFTWTNPDPQEGDFYIVEVVDIADSTPVVETVQATEFLAPVAASGQTCVDVTLVRANGTQQQDPAKTRGCAP